MKERNFWITNLKKIINQIQVDTSKFHIYLFGSSLYVNNPGDIDLLIVYEKSTVTIQEANIYRREIQLRIERLIDKIVDITLLSNIESMNNTFLIDENCRRIC